MEIIFEDKNIISVVKPVGVLSQSGSEKNMIDLLSSTEKEIFPIHRLDKNVGGVMIYAKTKQSAAKFSAMVQNGEIKKEYLAVITGIPEEKTGVFEDLLFKDSAKNKSYVVKRIRKGVKKAELEYELLETVNDNGIELSLVKILLHTGRSHQIRVQFSSRKMPLLGDGKYGSKSNKCDIALWSHRINFIHPFTNEKISVKSNPPENYPWNLFRY